MVTAVSELINQSLADDTKTVTLTSVKRNLNRGYQKVVNRVASLNQDYYLRLAKADLVADQSVYASPSDFKSLVRLELVYDGETRVKSRRISRQTINDPTVQISEGSPLHSIISNGFEIYPTPTGTYASGNKGLWLWYIESVANMAEDDDVPNVPLGYDDLALDYAVAMAKYTQGEADEGSLYMSMFRSEIDNMTSEKINIATDENNFVIMREVISE